MLRHLRNTLLLATISCTVSFALAQESNKKVSKERRDSQVEITRHADTDVIVIKGQHDAVKAAAHVIEQQEKRRQMVHINVTIAVSDTETGKNKVVDEIKLATLEDTPTNISVGQQVSVVVGTMQSRTGSAKIRTRQKETTGTAVKVTPTVTSHGIAMKLMVEKSWIDPQESTIATGDVVDVVPPIVFSGVLDSTIELVAGESQTFQALVSGGTAAGRVMLITISASTGSTIQQRSVARDRNSNKQPVVKERQPAKPASGERAAESPSRSSFRGGARGGAGASRSRTGAQSSSTAERSDDDSSDSAIARMTAKLFERFDMNKDGRLNSDELDQLPAQLRGSFDESDLSKEEFGKQFGDQLRKVRESRRVDSDD